MSRDSCNTWEKNKLPTSNVLGDANFLNGQIGIIEDFSGFFITKDSAQTFVRLDIYDSVNQRGLNNLCIVDTNIIYLEADGPYPNFHRYLYKSTNFGKTFFQIYNTTNIIHDTYFWNENKGVIVGKGRLSSHLVMLTSDGGKTWKTSLDTLIEPTYGIAQLIIKDHYAFGLGVYSILWRSTDTCKTWTKDLTFRYPALDVPASSIAFRTKDKLLVTSLGNGTIWEQDYSKITYIEREIFIDYSPFLFPNPATDFIEISLGAQQAMPLQIGIYDVFGREVNLTQSQDYPTPALPAGEGVKIDVSLLPPGVYFVRVGEKTQKFIIE